MKNMAQAYLLYYSLKYQGDWHEIYRAVANKEEVDYETLENTVNSFQGKFITILDEEYPEKLRQSFQPPFVLYYQGDISLLKNENIISVSCTRNPNRQDYHIADEVLKNDLNLTYLISSLKNDMDKHVLSLKKPTIAVLGHSLMEKQPMENYDTCDLILTELPPNTLEYSSQTLMARTRIIASLCDKEFVINAMLHSGTAVIVSHSLNLGKDVLVAPNIDRETLNFALMEDGAKLCYKPQHLL